MKGLTTEEFISKSNLKHENVYDYSKTIYENRRSLVTIICKQHGEFEQQAGSHMYGKGCSFCANNINISNEEFIEKAKRIHGEEYNYDKVEYKSAHRKVKIKCLKHGYFEQSPNSHYKGNGCPKCTHKISKPEMELQKFIRKAGFSIITNKKNIIKPYELDIFIPELNKAIEFNGTYWHYHSDHFVAGKHANKSNLCKEKGIKLLYIREDLWNKDKEKMKDITIKFLTNGECVECN
jgi:G:T-mismatch repair DNA endonuclease (very short patch repair protein)